MGQASSKATNSTTIKVGTTWKGTGTYLNGVATVQRVQNENGVQWVKFDLPGHGVEEITRDEFLMHFQQSGEAEGIKLTPRVYRTGGLGDNKAAELQAEANKQEVLRLAREIIARYEATDTTGANWGAVGDLGRAIDPLKDIADRLAGRGEYAPEARA
jgi:hypothetical protein